VKPPQPQAPLADVDGDAEHPLPLPTLCGLIHSVQLAHSSNPQVLQVAAEALTSVSSFPGASASFAGEYLVAPCPPFVGPFVPSSVATHVRNEPPA
jgi:hypothetical protein